MGSLDAHRRVVFAVALVALVLGAALIALLPRSTPIPASPHPARRAAPSQSASVGRDAIGAASISASRFAAGYLRYEEGVLGPVVRRSIRQFSTPEFGGQLLRAPVRIPLGIHPTRQWVARVAAVRVGLFDGHPALLAIIVIAAVDGGHLLRATLTEEGGRWLVAGIGP